jgi:hypothetical protein
MDLQNKGNQESRTSRHNVSVHHPSKWRFVEKLLASPMRIHRYRNLSQRMLKDVACKQLPGNCE